MRVLLLGGSGKTGQLFKSAAQAHEVVAPSRAECDVTSAESLGKALEGCDAVVALLSPRVKTDPVRSRCAEALVAAMKVRGVKRVVFVTAGGVGDSFEGARKTSFVYARVIIPLALKHQYADAARAEETLRGSGLDYTVVRPMQLVDAERGSDAVAIAPSEKSPSAKISRAQLARFILKELEQPGHVKKMPVLCG